MGDLFAAGKVRKTYWALVDGAPRESEGRIKVPIRKAGQGPGWKMVADPRNGQETITDDNGQVIRVEALDVIGADLEQLYDTLDARDLSAGSPLARRLFS